MLQRRSGLQIHVTPAPTSAQFADRQCADLVWFDGLRLVSPLAPGGNPKDTPILGSFGSDGGSLESLKEAVERKKGSVRCGEELSSQGSNKEGPTEKEQRRASTMAERSSICEP